MSNCQGNYIKRIANTDECKKVKKCFKPGVNVTISNDGTISVPCTNVRNCFQPGANVDISENGTISVPCENIRSCFSAGVNVEIDNGQINVPCENIRSCFSAGVNVTITNDGVINVPCQNIRSCFISGKNVEIGADGSINAPCERIRQCFQAGSNINIDPDGTISANIPPSTFNISFNNQTNLLSLTIDGQTQNVSIPDDGILSLNNLTSQHQTFAVGRNGNDFNIVSSGTQHVFNIPDASPSARGLVNTTTQSFVGDKIFENSVEIKGDLFVQGEQVILNTSILEIEDANITLNKNGNDLTAQGAGLTIKRSSIDGSIVYDSNLISKFASGDKGSESPILVLDSVISSDDSLILQKDYARGILNLKVNNKPGYTSVFTEIATSGVIEYSTLGDDLCFVNTSLTGDVEISIQSGQVGNRFTFNTNNLILNNFSFTVEGVPLLPNSVYEFVWDGNIWIQSK